MKRWLPAFSISDTLVSPLTDWHVDDDFAGVVFSVSWLGLLVEVTFARRVP